MVKHAVKSLSRPLNTLANQIITTDIYPNDPKKIKLNGIIIEHTDSFNFLGLTLHKNLLWTEHINNICSKVT